MNRQPSPLPYSQQDVPIETSRAPARQHPSGGGGVGGGGGSGLRPSGTLKRTLTRRDRAVAPPPLVAPPSLLPQTFSSSSPLTSSHSNHPNSKNHPNTLTKHSHTPFDPTHSKSFWSTTVRILTFFIPSALLSTCGIRNKAPQQAWREKIVLCLIALVLGGLVGFVTMGLNRTLCPRGVSADEEMVKQLGTGSGTVGISGWLFDASSSTTTTGTITLATLASQLAGQDVTTLFTRSTSDYPSCNGLTGLYATSGLCSSTSTTTNTGGAKNSSGGLSCPLSAPTTATFNSLALKNESLYVGYTWSQVQALTNYMVVNGFVLNMSPYLAANPIADGTDQVDTIIRQVLSAGNMTSSDNAGQSSDNLGSKDATRLLYNRQAGIQAVQCLLDKYAAGRIDKITPGCFVASLMLYALLIVILGIVLVRFAMALYFDWFLAKKMCRPPEPGMLERRWGANPSLMPAGASVSVHDQVKGMAPWVPGNGGSSGAGNKLQKGGTGGGKGSNPQIMTQNKIGAELFTFCLVTCYSEGEESIRNTLESIANTSYSDDRKMLFVVCDGMVTGHGEKAPTPDICVGMLEADSRLGDPTPMAYLSVGGGAKRENRAYVYAGHYQSKKRHRVPMLVVVKCGMPGEARESKPGNRGKRDSQMILMNWISRVTYNDRFTPLDYELFRKTHVLMNVTPDWFECVLMVDADTTVEEKSLTMLVNCMHHTNVMGVCGETHIQNKWASWISMIQTMEYVIAHRLAKAFESVFGGVTCLPGCFSMYRLKVPKGNGDDWIPILVDTGVIREYSQGEVHTLHTKNLLLLGEDRFLSTLMIRTFPGRDMSFCPQAECHTIVPTSFRVLLSQRRRWTSSTIHNLMELMRVQNLCGIFCFSMQFVVFCELVGTATLPVAMCLTYANIINIALSPPKTFEEAIPLILLVAVLGLPSLLVIITTRDPRHIFWTLIYLTIGLPVFNFIIPVHALWQQDNFAWGETRRVEGGGADTHEVQPGKDETAKVLAGTTTPLRRWADWERSRIRRLRRQDKKRKQMEERNRSDMSNHGVQGGGPGGVGEWATLRPNGFGSGSDPRWRDTDGYSIASSDEDVWGQDVGSYNEHLPPPLTAPTDPTNIAGPTLGADELAGMLEQGWGEERSSSPRGFDRRYRGGGGVGGTNGVSSPLAGGDGGEYSNGHGNGNGHGYGMISQPPPIQLKSAFDGHAIGNGNGNGNGYPMRQLRQDPPSSYANGNGNTTGYSQNRSNDHRFVIGGAEDINNPFGDEHQPNSSNGAISTGVQPSPRGVGMGHAKKRSLASDQQGQGQGQGRGGRKGGEDYGPL